MRRARVWSARLLLSTLFAACLAAIDFGDESQLVVDPDTSTWRVILSSGAVRDVTFEVDFDSDGLPSGVYIYRLVSDGFQAARALTVLR